ncbi:MAG: DUF368 domain-containing protein [Thermoflexales bacterium]
MGAADVVPGVSGGTMAFILGIYDELINALHSFNIQLIRQLLRLQLSEVLSAVPWKFLLALAAGIVSAIALLARPLKHALDTHPSLVFAFFFGLVLASVWVVRRRVERWTLPRAGLLLLAAAGAFALVGLTPTQTPAEPLSFFLSGVVAICAMILPGISGSFILVLLGKYEQLIGAVTQFDASVLIVFVAGCAVGLLSFVRVLRWLLRHYHGATLSALTGFMLGSLRRVWPWQDPNANNALVNVLPSQLDSDVLLATVLALLGVVLVIGLEQLAKRRDRTRALHASARDAMHHPAQVGAEQQM